MSYISYSPKHSSSHCFKLMLLCLLSALSLNLASVHAQLTLNSEAPTFKLLDQDGQEHDLAKYRGKTVVLEWTNPTCPFVVHHYKKDTMTKLAKEFSNVVWLTINSSYFTTQEENQKWAKLEGVKTVLADPTGKVGKLYGARTTPQMYIIDPAGKLTYQGAIDDNPHLDERKSLNYVAEALKSMKAGEKIKISETKPYGCSVKYKK